MSFSSLTVGLGSRQGDDSPVQWETTIEQLYLASRLTAIHPALRPEDESFAAPLLPTDEDSRSPLIPKVIAPFVKRAKAYVKSKGRKVMNATKRKFDKLLDKLTEPNRPAETHVSSKDDSTDNASVTASTSQGNIAKRARVDSVGRSNTPTSVAGPSVTIGNRANITSISQVARKTPKYAPWHQQHFLDRLKTFNNVLWWPSKPATIDSVEWAKRGWSCVARDRVGCVGGCSKEVFVKVYPEEGGNIAGTVEAASGQIKETNHQVELRLTEVYTGLIISAHAEGCLWRQRGCADTIYHLKFYPLSKSILELRTRYAGLLAIKDLIPAHVEIPGTVKLESIIEQLPDDFCKGTGRTEYDDPTLTPTDLINRGAFALALFGYRAEGLAANPMATCDACFRRVGLWLYKESSSKPSETVESEDVITSGNPTMAKLDVLAEHRAYCPWVNGKSQNGSRVPDGSAGWEVLVEALNRHQPGQKTDADQIDLIDFIRSTPPGGSKAGSMTGQAGISTDRATHDARDAERWSRLRQLRRAFVFKPKASGKVGKATTK